MTGFTDLWAALQSNFDTTFGERLEIHHLQPRNRGGQVSLSPPDPNRPPFVVTGLLTLAGQVAEVKGARLDATKAAIAIERDQVSFDQAVFDDVHQKPEKGTRIVALDRPLAPEFIVNSPAEPDGVARIKYLLQGD